MEWSSLYSPKRTGKPKSSSSDTRTDYQRDFDRLIFSSAFRRLQDKTQVFPLPGSTFVHNRLTHSLEVASVGRSLGHMVGSYVAQKEFNSSQLSERIFYLSDLSNIIAAACLAHDIGNPAFGHSGEDAISNYFLKGENGTIEGDTLRSFFSKKEWQDLISFEGNANALRILAQDFTGKVKGGLGLTYTTLASIFKYPCGSSEVDQSKKHRKKFSFFQSEKEIFNEVVHELNFHKDPDGEFIYKRHPFVYLVEAADDISYLIVDMEDAHRLGILSTKEITEVFWELINQIDPGTSESMMTTFRQLTDDNAAVSYLRAKCIGVLVKRCFDVFIDNSNSILNCNFESTLMDELSKQAPVLKKIEAISVEKIYNHDTVIEIELAGYNVMMELLNMFVPAVLKSNPSSYDKQVLKLIPKQYASYQDDINAYLKVMNVLDHVSSMTDIYATDLYRKVKGIEIPKHA